jgi:peptidoglycan hydrolase-like protein with peptidoglycan-binding domain
MGSIGPAVTAVQLALRNDGRDIQADGEFGPITFVALKAFEAAHGLPPDGIVDLPTAIALDKVAPPPSVLKVAPWLSTMRALTGTTEAPGSKDNPFIIEMAHEIVRRYPDLKGNVGWYNHDSIPWCGLGMGYVMAVNGIRPCDAPLSALAWASWGQKLALPRPARCWSTAAPAAATSRSTRARTPIGTTAAAATSPTRSTSPGFRSRDRSRRSAGLPDIRCRPPGARSASPATR